MSLFVGLAVLVNFKTGAVAGSNEGHDVLDFLRARDEVISSFRISLSVSEGTAGTDVQRLISSRVKALQKKDADSETLGAMLCDLMMEAAGHQPLHTREVSVHSKGAKFRQVERLGGERIIQQFDGETYVFYRPDTPQNQADVYSALQPNMRWDLEELNIRLGHLLDYPLVSSSANNESYTLEFMVSEDTQKTARFEFDSQLALDHVLVMKKGELFAERWYFGHREETGLQVPRAILEVRRSVGGYEFFSIVIDEFSLNCEIEDDELWVALPPSALVVDHRAHPPEIYRLLGAKDALRRSDLNNDVLSLETGIPAAAVQTSVPAYEDLQPHIETHGVMHAQGGERAEARGWRQENVGRLLALTGLLLLTAYVVLARRRKRAAEVEK